MARPIDLSHISLSWEDVDMHADHRLLMEVNFNSAMIVSYQQGILDQQLRPHSIHY